MSYRAPVLVYTMGKVASTSVSDALVLAGRDCLDIHFLEPGRVEHIEARYLNDPEYGPEGVPPHVARSKIALDVMQYFDQIDIISLIREPIGRNLANIFQNMPPSLQEGIDVPLVVSRFRNYPPRIADDWFLEDFIPATGLDVFAEEFETEADYFLFENERFRVLFIKTDADDRVKNDVISGFAGKNVRIERSNDSRNKYYGEVMARFKADPSLIDREYAEECMALTYFQKFFSPDERRQVADRYGLNAPVAELSRIGS